MTFFLILTWAFRGRWGRRRPPSEGGRFWGWNFFFTKTNNLAFQLCFPCYGIFPTRNALKLTFVFFQFQLLAPAMCYIMPIWVFSTDHDHIKYQQITSVSRWAENLEILTYISLTLTVYDKSNQGFPGQNGIWMK